MRTKPTGDDPQAHLPHEDPEGVPPADRTGARRWHPRDLVPILAPLLFLVTPNVIVVLMWVRSEMYNAAAGLPIRTDCGTLFSILSLMAAATLCGLLALRALHGDGDRPPSS
jgi:hypothetical protein